MNTKESAEIKTLLQKYKADECTPEERARVEAWLEQLGKQSQTSVAGSAEDRILDRTRKRVLSQIPTQSATNKVYVLQYLKIAALLLLVPAGFLLYSKLNRPAPQALQQYFTARGERKVLTLPDSTTVTLNSSSVLTISSDFGVKNRVVKLSGEGFFHVKHDASKPFIVATGNIQTQVLGTQFNVHAYNNESEYKIAVVSGMVSVGENRATNKVVPLGKILTRNLMLVYNSKAHQHYIKTADADRLSAWQNGRLYFDEASVPEIGLTLSRMYNIDVQLADKPGRDCKYTIGFDNQPLDKVLRVLSQLTGITYQYTTSKIIIHSKNCR
jgi:ferric-dicitrate binding protein FerR (iron transport regulator)